MDAREADHVLANLRGRATDPQRYRKWCWRCSAIVDEATNEHCERCGWLVCWCGACRDPDYLDRQGLIGHCSREVWSRRDEDIPDADFEGRPILTAGPPSPDAAAVRGILDAARVTALYHWSPSRSKGSVLRLGLLAPNELDARGIPFQRHGYGNQDKRELLAQFVSVSFRPKARMMRAWSETPVLWRLDPEVLTTTGTLFLPDNGASDAISAERIARCTGPRALVAALEAHLRAGSQPEMLTPRRVPRVALTQAYAPDEQLAAKIRHDAEEAGVHRQFQVEVRSGMSGPP